MVASTYSWRSNWIGAGFWIGLAGCLIVPAGYWAVSAAYRSWWPVTVPGDAEYAAGCQSLDAGNLEQAVAAFSAAIDKSPQYEMAFFKRAKARQLQRRTDAAIDDYTKALHLDSGHAEAYYGRGSAYLEKGSLELAIDDLAEAMRLAPDSCEAVRLRAQANLMAGQYAAAIADARLAIRLNGKCGEAFLTLGSASCPRRTNHPRRPPSASRRHAASTKH